MYAVVVVALAALQPSYSPVFITFLAEGLSGQLAKMIGHFHCLTSADCIKGGACRPLCFVPFFFPPPPSYPSLDFSRPWLPCSGVNNGKLKTAAAAELETQRSRNGVEAVAKKLMVAKALRAGFRATAVASLKKGVTLSKVKAATTRDFKALPAAMQTLMRVSDSKEAGA